MSVGANRLEGLKVDLTVDDLWGAKSVSGLAQLARAEVAGQSIADVKLTATGHARRRAISTSAAPRAAWR